MFHGGSFLKLVKDPGNGLKSIRGSWRDHFGGISGVLDTFRGTFFFSQSMFLPLVWFEQMIGICMIFKICSEGFVVVRLMKDVQGIWDAAMPIP